MAKKSILFLSPYPKYRAPSQRLKYEQYYQYFEEAGYLITTSSFVSEKFWGVIYKPGKWPIKGYYTFLGYIRRINDLLRAKKYDIVYVHLWVTPIGFPIFEWALSKITKRLIYDIDDMVFLGHSSEANAFFQAIKGKKKMIYLMQKADHIITCTPSLDKFARQFNPSTTDISSTIDTVKYQPKLNYEKAGSFVLGWSGSHSTSKYLKLLEPAFLKLKDRIDFQVLVIGDSNFEFNSKEIPLKAIKWSLETEVEDLCKIDIGLYPLPDEPWVYGKSGLKALQYMALGIPTVATSIGANIRIIKSGNNGYLVNGVNQWVETIELLCKNQEMRKSIGRQGRHRVEERFSIENNKHLYLNAVKQLTKNAN